MFLSGLGIMLVGYLASAVLITTFGLDNLSGQDTDSYKITP